MIIHQPRIEAFNLFDDILLLANGGKTVFEGPREKMNNYFLSNYKINMEALEEENPVAHKFILVLTSSINTRFCSIKIFFFVQDF